MAIGLSHYIYGDLLWSNRTLTESILNRFCFSHFSLVSFNIFKGFFRIMELTPLCQILSISVFIHVFPNS